MVSISQFVQENVVAQEDSPIRAMNQRVNSLNKERERDGFPKIPNLSMGVPNFPPSKALINEIKQRWEKISESSPDDQAAFFAYQNPQGVDETREKISQLYKKQYPESDIKSDSVMIFSGATHFTSTLFSSLLNEKNGEKAKVAVFAPHFPTQKDQVEMSGKQFVPIHIKDDESPAQALSRTIDDNKTKDGGNTISAVFLSYPTNPTGSYYSKDELSGIMDVVQKQGDMMLGVERLYDKISKNPEDIIYPLDIKPQYHREVPYAEAASLSKGHSLPGSHIAYGFASSELMQKMSKVSFKTVCGPSAEAENTLRTVIDAELDGKLDKWKDDMRTHYMERVDALSGNMPDGFQKHPLVNDERHGSFYVTMGAPEWIGKNIPDTVTHKKGDKIRKIEGIREKLGKDKFESGFDIARFLVESETVAAVPLKPFGLDEPYFRASCATDKDAIKRAVAGMSACNKGIMEGKGVVIEHDEKNLSQNMAGNFADTIQKREMPEKQESRVAALIARFENGNARVAG